MFNIGGAELILILVIAFVVVGPDDLPKVARALGRFVRQISALMKELKAETGFDELEKEFKGISNDVHSAGKQVSDTLKQADIRPDLQKEIGEIRQDVHNAVKPAENKAAAQPLAAEEAAPAGTPEAESTPGAPAAPEKPKKTLGYKEFAERMRKSGNPPANP